MTQRAATASANERGRTSTESADTDASRRQLAFGWWALLVYLTGGIVLEALHAIKLDYYLNHANETRRLLWTLAHAHGTLLALINIALGFTLRAHGAAFSATAKSVASRCLIGAAVLLPAGFFLGGVFINPSLDEPSRADPGLPILLVPVGALLLLIGVFTAARGVGNGRAD